MGYLTKNPIDIEEWHRQASDPRDGASVEFLGVVRGEEAGRKIPFLEYEAHVPMAEKVIAALVEEAKGRWLLHQIYVRHRIGRVEAGAVSVMIGVQAPHREKAFEACRFLIDRIKEDAPIWKRGNAHRDFAGDFKEKRSAAGKA